MGHSRFSHCLSFHSRDEEGIGQGWGLAGGNVAGVSLAPPLSWLLTPAPCPLPTPHTQPCHCSIPIPAPPALILSIKWNLIRLGDPTHGIVTKMYTKLCQEVVWVKGWWCGGCRGWWVRCMGSRVMVTG